MTVTASGGGLSGPLYLKHRRAPLLPQIPKTPDSALYFIMFIYLLYLMIICLLTIEYKVLEKRGFSSVFWCLVLVPGTMPGT